PLYGPPGYAYVYLNYGIHCLVNIVAEREGSPAAVLIRALEPIDGIETMQRRRGRIAKGRRAIADRSALPTHELCRGPGNLTMAMGIRLAENRVDLLGDRLYVEDRAIAVAEIEWTPRVGITVGVEHPWRASIRNHPAVSVRPRSSLAARGSDAAPRRS